MKNIDSRGYSSPVCHIMAVKFGAGLCAQSSTSEIFNTIDPQTDYRGQGDGIVW